MRRGKKRIISVLLCMTMFYMSFSAVNKMFVVNAADLGYTPSPFPSNQQCNIPAATSTRFNLTDYDEWPENPGDSSIALWNDDKVGAFSITIDDNNDADHNTWLDFSRKYGFNFTWFVITGYSPAASGHPAFDSREWSRMIAAGQDIQSHTWHHYNATIANKLTVDDLTQEYTKPIHDINRLPGGNCKTMGYVGGYTNQPLATQYFIAARGTVGTPNQANKVDYLNLNSVTMRGNTPIYYSTSSSSVEGIVKTLYDSNYKPWGTSYYHGWTNVHYHDILSKGYGYADGNNPDLGSNTYAVSIAQKMFDFLDQSRDKLWVDTFTNIAMYGQERDTTMLTKLDSYNSHITFNITDKMNDELFNYPLTVKTRIDNAWENVTATQNGKSVECKTVVNQGNKYVLVKAIPDRGTVEIIPGFDISVNSQSWDNNALTVNVSAGNKSCVNRNVYIIFTVFDAITNQLIRYPNRSVKFYSQSNHRN